MTLYPPDGKYRIETTINPDMDGDYFARVYFGDDFLTSVMDQDSAAATAKATQYVEWHRSPSRLAVEVVEL